MGVHTSLAPRMHTLRESPTAVVADLMRAMSERGETVINFGEGELDFETPDFIKNAGIEAIRSGHTRYTAVGGTRELKEAVQAKFRTDNWLDYDLDQIMVGTGGKQIIFNAFMVSVSNGDEVIIPAPYWVSYPDIVRLVGGSPVIVPTDEEGGFKISAAQLRAALTDKTKWLVLNSPNNPSGAVYSEAELASLLDVISDWPQVAVLADDIYEHIVHDGQFATPASVRPDLADRILTVNGVSKAYAMTGWRIGFAGGPAWLISAMQALQSQSTTNAAAMCQEAARIALTGSRNFLASWMAQLRTRRDFAAAAINETPGLHCRPSAGAFYLFVNCSELIGKCSPSGAVLHDDGDIARYLAEEAGVGVVPGTAFGTSPYFRIAYAVADDLLADGCRRIREACSRLR
jgi:aspartate aminotransferase